VGAWLNMLKIGKSQHKEDSEMAGNGSNMSNHILPTSSNLLGLCFVILSFIKLSKMADATILDEATAAAIVLFLISSITSYMSIRSAEKGLSLEKIADIIFLLGLLLLAVISVIVAFELAY
jgi:hypothetical protein